MSNSLDPDQARRIVSGLIWVQTVCQGYQQTTLVDKESICFITAPRGDLGQMCNVDGSCNNNALTCTQLNNRATVTCECSAGYAESGGTCIASKYNTHRVQRSWFCGQFFLLLFFSNQIASILLYVT